jgi:DNA excision repair protein ERCC-2
MHDVALPPGASATGYSVAVRTLCEFTSRTGDLSVRFTPAPTAQQGIAGHGILAARRGAAYQRELPLEGRHRLLTVRGRADGYDPAARRLEEFKTHRGDLARLPANQRSLHWAQLKMYGALLCLARGFDDIELALVYFDVRSEQEVSLPARYSAAELRTFFESQCESFLQWAMGEVQHRERRDAYLESLKFPHAALRPGQRQMAESVYRSARDGRIQMIQAPTGIGKTVGSIFPLLKAMPPARLDKLFYLAAKTPGRALALDALAILGSAAGARPLRVLELVAKDSACRYPGRPCEAASCPLAAGFYDRVGSARLAALADGALSHDAVRRIAGDARVCPYYLTQELARWCDVIVGDYNYFFDTRALLHALTAQNQWRIGVLIDEAHNLVTRARDMYSATLAPDAVEAAQLVASAAVKPLLGPLARTLQALQHGRADDYFVEACIPAALTHQLQRLTAAIGDEAGEQEHVPDAVLRVHFDALHFCRMADAFGPHSLFDVTRTAAGARLCIRNVNPAPFLAPRFAACSTAILFSATLSPAGFHRRLLGLPENAAWMNVDSPFGENQLVVHVERRISTRYRDRPRSLEPIADLIARQYRAEPGNYLAFFSSFEYLGAALAVFQDRHPEVPCWNQIPAMDGGQRTAFLARFTATSRGIGFAVLGGAFAEGVDLPGERLIGAFIATLGLPRVDGINSEIERRLHELFEAGYEYTYLYPGLQKVVQAAGRVIRSATDRGTVYLIDDRYMDARVRRLLPQWWRIRCSGSLS